MDQKRLVLNGSMCKAGSELLQALFHQHPDIYASATSPIPDYWKSIHVATTSQASMAMPVGKRRKAFAEGFRGFINGFYGALTNRSVVMDKSREWPMLVNTMSEIMDQWPIKVVCLVRDLREIVASLERTYRYNGIMLPLPQPEQRGPNQRALTPPREYAQRIMRFMEIPPLSGSLSAIMESINQGTMVPLNDDGTPVASGTPEADKAVLCVRYDHFVADPEKWVLRMYSHLGITPPPKGHDFENVTRDPSLEIEGAFGPFGDHRLTSASVEVRETEKSFKDVITDEAEVAIAQKGLAFMEHFRYV